MSLETALNIFLDEYEAAKEQPFAGHALANFIRHDIPEYLEEVIGPSDRYFAHGSAGQGNWANVPWVAIFDRLITDTAQDGYDIVYLVKEDYSGVYISLNQGVTTIRNVYGSDAKEALRARAGDFLARLGGIPNEYITGQLDLATVSSSSLGSYYEYGNVIAKYYEKGSVPNDDVLEKDLKNFLSYYLLLASKDLLPSVNTAEEEDEKGLELEDLTKLKEHKRIERNRKLAQKAKKIHGYKCQACDFDFKTKYGEIGDSFIEAHHLTPISKLKGQKVALDPEKDFAVLCSNCHRMIHKTELVSHVVEFREKYVVKKG
tara:strand:- start:11549 stop:12499 length:951 start_codon:yes stop_codon:yes gene_type:complete